MNSIPKLKITKNKINDDITIKDIYFQKQFRKTLKLLWIQPKSIEIVAIGSLLSTDFNTIEEFDTISGYYQNILHNLKTEFDIPIIFVGSNFNMQRNNIECEKSKGKILIPKCIFINEEGENNIYKINLVNSKKHVDFNYPFEKIKYKESKQKIILKKETSKTDFYDMIEKSKKLIKSNILEKIVISRTKKYKFNFDWIEQLSFLKKANIIFPESTTFLFNFTKDDIFFGVTPETLFKINGTQFYSEALAGTFDASANYPKSKETKEHNYVIDYIEKVISNFSIEKKTQTNPHLINFGKLKHLKTQFNSKIVKNVTPFKIIYQLHPTPAVAGIPKNNALNYIKKLEYHDRKWYSGPIGWISSKGNAEFKAAIRSGYSKNGCIEIFAGCGITDGSQSECEFNESEKKFDSILSVLKND